MTCILCARPVRARGLCRMHYQRHLKAGTLNTVALPHQHNPHSCPPPNEHWTYDGDTTPFRGVQVFTGITVQRHWGGAA